MIAEFYVVIQGKKSRYVRDERRELGHVRVAKKKPAVAQDEIAVKIALDVPDSLFFKPTLSVMATVPAARGIGGEITADVQQQIADIIQQQTGLSVRIEATETPCD